MQNEINGIGAVATCFQEPSKKLSVSDFTTRRSRATSAAFLTSPGVNSEGHGGGVDNGTAKRIKDRKRHLPVDTLGLVSGVVVTLDSATERAGAQLVLGQEQGWFTWLHILWVDCGHTGVTFAHWVKNLRPKLVVEVVKRSTAIDGFKVLPGRWLVERTFDWLLR